MNAETVELKINEHAETLKEHSKEIDNLKQDGREFKTEIKNLCDNIKNLTSAMKWFMGIWVTSLLGFFFMQFKVGYFRI
ncbi:hemolysin XhlA family protein [Clostridium estertheticum]|uniref:hemolysin XhlA family protein n=1 Tax=Clostridium estertheticum TaxID=238834 RepID=UPI0013E93686|nr:hemolysin XhlA family protein [Clostridium estertheticum]MBZ9687571.1 hemolysin XhlA family protein [Clostridium estertheticum]